MTETIKIKRLHPDAVLPKKAHEGDAGFDLVAVEDVIIEPGETALVPTGIAVEMPDGFELQVRPRSGITLKTNLRVQLGTVDSNYRGEIGVIVDNSFDRDEEDRHDYYVEVISVTGDLTRVGGRLPFGTYLVRKGDRIAQAVIQRLPSVELVEVEELGESSRGEGGFGSSGVGSEEVGGTCDNCGGSMFANHRISLEGKREFGYSCHCGNECWEVR